MRHLGICLPVISDLCAGLILSIFLLTIPTYVQAFPMTSLQVLGELRAGFAFEEAPAGHMLIDVCRPRL